MKIIIRVAENLVHRVSVENEDASDELEFEVRDYDWPREGETEGQEVREDESGEYVRYDPHFIDAPNRRKP